MRELLGAHITNNSNVQGGWQIFQSSNPEVGEDLQQGFKNKAYYRKTTITEMQNKNQKREI